ncbi:hypothetical protein [Shimia sp. Alg240-R146]|uniref:hypothetical protein n=1 Tax=Shimia sp. Alg240-R146 TaxID=2993449 RepID=UPI0022E2EE9E|nr:hypothetical protein [Shimia sp. Alg240-R146]
MKKQKFFNVLTAEIRLALRRIAMRYATILRGLFCALLSPTIAQASHGETCDRVARLYRETKSWDSAAAAYQSRTPKYANKYKARYRQILANLPDIPALGVATRTANNVNAPRREVAQQVSVNAFPLLRKGAGVSGMGSLVPLGNGESRPLFGGGD